MTPWAAARQKADPRASKTASRRLEVKVGSRSANSRVAGAPPRTSPDPTVPAGATITVTPVARPVQCPTRRPSITRSAHFTAGDRRGRGGSVPGGGVRGERADLAGEVDDELVDQLGALG